VALATTAAVVLGAAAVGGITYGFASADAPATTTTTTNQSGGEQLQAPDNDPGLSFGRADTGSGAS
jgi:hypothetical protein